MRISILIPCHNEEKTIRRSIETCLDQTRPADEIIVVDDSSSDNTPTVLKEFGDRIRVVRTPRCMGNKSYAQEYGLQFVTGDVLISTDADTLLHREFIKKITKDFEDPKIVAVGGYVKSRKHNWITRHRAFEYAIGQNFHKLAQSHLGFMFVIPGAAGAFRTSMFREYLTFDHDTLTEDLDFTYKIHKNGFKIHYNRNAIVYTQDPATLSCYINQMRRWYGGGWQNLMKHYDIAQKPAQALELSLMYFEGLVYSFLIYIIPVINLRFAAFLLLFSLPIAFLFSVLAAMKERRWDMLLVCIPYLFLTYVNAYIFIEQFVREVLLRRKNLIWFTPKRIIS